MCPAYRFPFPLFLCLLSPAVSAMVAEVFFYNGNYTRSFVRSVVRWFASLLSRPEPQPVIPFHAHYRNFPTEIELRRYGCFRPHDNHDRRSRIGVGEAKDNDISSS